MYDKVLEEDLDLIAGSNLPFEKLSNSTVLVTGATGLIGVSLIRALMRINDVRKTSIRILALIRNRDKAEAIYGNLLSRTDIKLVVGDVIEVIEITEKIDFIFHCASVTASKMMVTQPVETLMTSVMGTKNILDLAKEKNCKSVVYLSSMEMYGSFSDNSKEVTEEDLGYINPLKVRSNYPESKRLCENMCIAYLNEYSVPVKIARLAQTFGAGILPGENRVFAQFARSIINGEDIVLHTLGQSDGNYCYTSDAVSALLTILLNGENGEAYNVSNPETYTTISEMAHMVCREFSNGNSHVVFDIPETNTYGYAADTKMKLNSDKLQSLGWIPKVNLRTAYERLIQSLISQSD